MSPGRMDLPQGVLDLVVLQVVACGPIHGYGIAQRIRRASRDAVQVPQGSLYPALHRLERRKLLMAEWKPSDTGRVAKFYQLTPSGRARLRERTVRWLRLAEGVGLILDTAGGGVR